MTDKRSTQAVIECMKIIITNKFSTPEIKGSSLIDTHSKSYCCHDFLNKDFLNIMSKKLLQIKHMQNVSKYILNTNKVSKQCNCHSDSELDVMFCVSDLCYSFIITSLNTLVTLRYVIDAFEAQKDGSNLLGVNDQKIIKDVSDLVVAFGILPNLLDGVGLPVKNVDHIYGHKHPRKLFFVIKSLLFVLQNECLRDILLPSLRSDLLASLIQLSNNPLKNDFINCQCTIDKVVCHCCNDICEHEKGWCQQELSSFLARSSQMIIIKELLLLQRSGTGGKRPKYEWYQNAIGDLLSQGLMRKNGVKVMLTVILEGCNQDKLTAAQYKSMGKVLAKVPKQIKTKEEYFSIIIPQVFRLISTPPSKTVSHFIAIAAYCIEDVLENHHDIGADSIRKQALSSFIKLYACDLVEIHEVVLAKELQIIYNCSGNTVEVLSDDIKLKLREDALLIKEFNLELRICTSQSADCLIPMTAEVIHACYVLYCLIECPPIKQMLNQVLISILVKNSIKDSIKYLGLFIFPESLSCFIAQVSPDMKIKYYGVNDVAENEEDSAYTEKFLSFKEVTLEKKIILLISILQHSSLEEIRCEFFIDLLNRLTDLIKKNTIHMNEDSICSGHSFELLKIDKNIEDIQQKIEIFSLISALMDTFGDSVLKNTPQIVSFIKCMLTWSWYKEENALNILHKENEAVDLCLLLLSTLLGTGKLTTADYKVMHDLLPALKNISLKHRNQSTCNMANDLQVFIATHGAVTSSTCSKSNGQTKKCLDLSSEDAYLDAMNDMLDPLLPTRGHALFQLSKLLQKRNKWAIKDCDRLLDIFETNLSHEDTYLYLASLEGLLELVSVNHGKVLPILCRKFAQIQGKNEFLSTELRMKLCEAIVKSCHLCSTFLPSYAHVVVPALLIGVKDSDSFIRTSSLSALGDVSGALQFGLGPYLAEITSAIYHVVSTDKSCEVRRAGVQVFSIMFKGMGTRLLQIIPDEIKEVYRVLNLIARNDSDELTTMHAGNALNILDDIMKEILSKKPSIEKKIQVLPDI